MLKLRMNDINPIFMINSNVVLPVGQFKHTDKWLQSRIYLNTATMIQRSGQMMRVCQLILIFPGLFSKTHLIFLLTRPPHHH